MSSWRSRYKDIFFCPILVATSAVYTTVTVSALLLFGSVLLAFTLPAASVAVGGAVMPAEKPVYWTTASKFSHNVASRVEREAAKTVDCYPYLPFVSSRVLPREMAIPHAPRPTK